MGWWRREVDCRGMPLLFAAGMTLIDTVTEAVMREAYRWALQNPVRRVFYNIAVTSLSVALAMILGTVLLLQMAAQRPRPQQRLLGPGAIARPRHLGYGMVAVSVLIWAGAAIVWKKRIQPKERT